MPKLSQNKRYALGFSTLGIIGEIAALASEKVDEDFNPILIMCAFWIGIALNLCGLIGAWSENFCLTCTYTVFQIFRTILVFILAFFDPTMWLEFVVNLIICCVFVFFLMDLRSVRREREAGGDSA